MKITSLTVLAALALGVSTAAHAETILVQEDFGGLGSDPLNGTTAVVDAGVVLAGGSATWSAGADFMADGSLLAAPSGNTSASLSLGTYIDDAEGSADGLFVLQVTIADITSPSNGFVSLGFAASTSPSTSFNFLGDVPFGTAGTTAHLILRASGENDAFVDNPAGNNGLAIDGDTANAVDHTLTITIDVRDHNGVDNFGSVTFESSATGLIDNNDVNIDGAYEFTSDQTFGSILLSDNSSTSSAFSDLTLTQVPEPGSLALLGLGGLMIARRRRQA